MSQPGGESLSTRAVAAAAEIEDLRDRLAEAEEAIRAIRGGEVDALVVGVPGTERVYTIDGADLAYRHLFEQMSEGAAVLDHAGVILFGNGRLGAMLAKPMEQVIGSLFGHHVDETDRKLIDGLMIRARRGVCQEDIELIKGDGTRLPAHISMAPFESRGLEAACLILTDLSARFQIERELRHARAAAEAANQAKGEFLAHMSHEIRTPMNAILGLTELTLATPLGREQRENLELAQSATHSLLSIIDDILDFSKIEAGRLVLELVEFEPRQQFQDALHLLAKRAAAKGLELECAIDAQVPRLLLGDASRLRQVLINLVGNAIKFTEIGKITVAIEGEPGLLADRGIELRFRITDTGIGIPAEQQAAIFEPFTQANHSTTRNHGGTGLGLSITSSLVSLMGGQIAVTSEIGVGSTFHFTVRVQEAPNPRGPQENNASECHPAQAQPPREARILKIAVAEDNPLNQRVAALILERKHHRVTLAGNGSELLDLMAREPFDLVLMDMQMPVMDGLQATTAIRARERGTGRHTPIIAMTANVLNEDRQRCLSAGMDGFVPKPVRQIELFSAIETAILAAGERSSETALLTSKGASSAAEEALPLELILLFLELFPGQLAEVRGAMERRDGTGLCLSAHTFKGSLGVLQAQDAVAAAFRLEQLARANDWEHVDEAWTRLDSEVSRLVATIDIARDPVNPGPSSQDRSLATTISESLLNRPVLDRSVVPR